MTDKQSGDAHTVRTFPQVGRVFTQLALSPLGVMRPNARPPNEPSRTSVMDAGVATLGKADQSGDYQWRGMNEWKGIRGFWT